MAEEVTRLLTKQRRTLQHNQKTVVRQAQSKAAKRVVRERHARKGAEKAFDKAYQKKAAHLQGVRNNFYAGHHQRQQQQQRHQPQHQHQHQQR